MSSTADYLPELFASFGRITLRRMFGGHGVYHDGLMFGLVIDDTLYLKCDPLIAADFEAEGLEPFTYSDRNGRRAVMSYRRAPEALLDDPELAAQWARKAYAAAVRAQAAARKPRRQPSRRNAP